MKILQVIPRRETESKLTALLAATERELRGSRTTFYRKKNRWFHKRYKGWIRCAEAAGGVLVAEVKSQAPETEWQLLQAFVGYLDRHLGDDLESVAIHYR
jgi:hypothetical protein